MRQFGRAMMRLPLAASLVGMKHLSGRFAASTGGDVLPRAEAQLARLMREAFKTGDRLTADVVDPALGFVTQEGLSSGHVMKLGFDATQKLAEVFAPWTTGSDLAWLEFGNKLQSFGTFRYVASMLDMPVETDIPLAQWVAQAAKLDAYLSVWATEGLGYDWTEKAWRRGTPEGLLQAVSVRGLVALHAGMGLSLAKRVCAGLRADASDAQMRDGLQRFVDLCQANAHSGYAGVALEALGLVVQTYYPELRMRVDRRLMDRMPEERAHFWHGLGRGAYFMPRSSAAWHDLAVLRAPHEMGRLNLASGLAWPLVLVNIRHPQIVAQFVARHGAVLEESDAFADGVGAAVMVWFNATGGDVYLDGFRRYCPDGANRALARRWEALVRVPCQVALEEQYDAIRQQQRFGDLFRYRGQI